MYDTRNNGTSDGCIDDFCLEIILFCFACVCALALVIWLRNLLSFGIYPSSLSPSSSNIFDLFFLPFLIWIFYTVEFIWRRKSHQKWLNMTNRSQLLTEFIGNPFFSPSLDEHLCHIFRWSVVYWAVAFSIIPYNVFNLLIFLQLQIFGKHSKVISEWSLFSQCTYQLLLEQISSPTLS